MVQINNASNNTVGASNSGQTNTLTVTNSSNTASSAALVNVTVGGASASDAFTTYTVSGTTNWSEGVDNSDSDAYALAASTALGTTNVMKASTAGEINYPLQPAFLAVGAGGTDVTGDGTLYILGSASAWTEIYDQNSDFNTDGTFTAPVTGKYHFDANIMVTQLAVAHTDQNIQLIASNRTLVASQCNPFVAANPGTSFAITIASYVDMDAADTCTCATRVSNGTKVVDINPAFAGNVNFSGKLVC